VGKVYSNIMLDPNQNSRDVIINVEYTNPGLDLHRGCSIMVESVMYM